VMAELHVHDIQASISLPFVFGAFAEDGSIKDPSTSKSAQAVLDQLEWWTSTLKSGRETNPFNA